MFRKLLFKLFKIPNNPNVVHYREAGKAVVCGFKAGLGIKGEEKEDGEV